MTITTPLCDNDITRLKAGDTVYISGVIYTGRDAAHKRMYEAALKNEEPPFDFSGAVIYYAGPAPPPPGRIIGSIGPTTSGRMDTYSPLLIERGLKAMIGKGGRSADVISAVKKHCGVYFAATGGVGALLAKRVTSSQIIAYEDLGTEAIRRLEVLNFPVIVAIDAFGGSVYGK